MVWWLGRKTEAIGRRTEAQLHAIQAAQLELNRRQRRDSLIARLPEESSPDIFIALTRELVDYSSHDLALLRSAERQNPLTELPSFGRIDSLTAEDFVRSLPRRYREARGWGAPFPGLVPFIALCHESLASTDFTRLRFDDLLCREELTTQIETGTSSSSSLTTEDHPRFGALSRSALVARMVSW